MPLQPSRIADTLNRGTSCRVVVNYDATMMNLAASIDSKFCTRSLRHWSEGRGLAACSLSSEGLPITSDLRFVRQWLELAI